MKFLDLGKLCYAEAYEIQKDYLERRIAGTVEDTLLLVEHDPVYTVGRAASVRGHYPKEIAVPRLGKVPVWEIERGGKITFHGPGQIVGYPIFHLSHHDIRKYLQDMEHILCKTLLDLALLPAKPCPENLILEPGQLQTGVWVHDQKIASIGIAVKRWVSWHGFALNVSTDLRYFNAVDPCGFRGDVITNVENEVGSKKILTQSNFLSNAKEMLAEQFVALSDRYQQKKMNISPAPVASV